MSNDKVLKVVKTVVTVASVGISLVASYIADKELNSKIESAVADALAKNTEN